MVYIIIDSTVAPTKKSSGKHAIELKQKELVGKLGSFGHGFSVESTPNLVTIDEFSYKADRIRL